MELKKTIEERLTAAFSGIWLRSFEHLTVLKDLAELVSSKPNWKLIRWDPEVGTVVVDGTKMTEEVVEKGNASPLLAINTARQLVNTLTEDGGDWVLLVMRNLHLYLCGSDGRTVNPVLMQTVQNTVEMGSNNGLVLINLTYPGINPPAELDKTFHVIDHDMPTAEEFWRVLVDQVVPAKNQHIIPGRDTPEMEKYLTAAAGLTRREFSDAAALGLVRGQMFNPESMWSQKQQTVNQRGLIEVYQPETGFDMLGGMVPLKNFMYQSLTDQDPKSPAWPLGVILFGLPGTGKSAICNAVGYECDLPVIRVDMGRLQGGIVGQTEQQTRGAIKQIEHMRPCILIMD